MVGSVVETAAAEERLVELPLAVSASPLPWQLATNWLSDWPVGVKMNGLHSHSLSLSLSLSPPSTRLLPTFFPSFPLMHTHTYTHNSVLLLSISLCLLQCIHTHTHTRTYIHHTHPPSHTPHPHPSYFTHTHTHSTQPSTIPHTHPQPTCSSPGLPAPPCTP